MRLKIFLLTFLVFAPNSVFGDEISDDVKQSLNKFTLFLSQTIKEFLNSLKDNLKLLLVKATNIQQMIKYETDEAISKAVDYTFRLFKAREDMIQCVVGHHWYIEPEIVKELQTCFAYQVKNAADLTSTGINKIKSYFGVTGVFQRERISCKEDSTCLRNLQNKILGDSQVFHDEMTTTFYETLHNLGVIESQMKICGLTYIEKTNEMISDSFYKIYQCLDNKD